MRIFTFRVVYVGGDSHPRRGQTLLHTLCTARARNKTVAMRRAVDHILRERRRDPNVSGWELHSITFHSVN